MRKFLLLIPLLSVLFSCGENYTFDIFRPSDLTVTYISNSEVLLNWTDNTDNETGFVIQRELQEGRFQTIFTTVENITSFADTTVIVEKTYKYRVAADVDSDISDWSNIAEIYVSKDFSDMFFGTNETLEIMTWNLRNFPLANNTTVNKVNEVIKNLDVDIVALQEIESNQYFEDLTEALEGWTGYRANSAYQSINLAFLYKDELAVIDIYEIFTEDSYAFPRSPLVIEIEYEGNFVTVINNHFKAFGEPDDVARRRAAVQHLDEYVSAHILFEDVIITGDLNDEIQEPEALNVFWDFLSEPQEYLFADMEIAQGNRSYWSWGNGGSHLDHILITNELFDEFNNPQSDIQTIIVDDFLPDGWQQYSSEISDHRPVAIRLKFGE